MPSAKSGAAMMPGDRGRVVNAVERLRGAAQAEIDVLQIRFEVLFQKTHAAEQLGAEEGGGPRRGWDAAGLGERRAVGAAVADAPGGAAATDCVEGPVDPPGR